MSSSAPGGPGSGERSQSFSKFMRRASKVLKRGSSSKDSVPTVSGTQSASRRTGQAESSPAPLGRYVLRHLFYTSQCHQLTNRSAPIIAPLGFDPSAVGSSDVTGKPIQEEATPAPSVPAAISQSVRDTKPSTKPTNARFATTAAQSNTIQEEKARILFAKYGITLEPGEWTAPTKGDGERVEKKIRMRVHRTCHRCQVTFGPEKVCTNCDHNRCKKCPKFPVRKPKSKGKGLGAGAISGEDATKGKSKILTMPSRVTGKELARKDPSQRVRRTCHKCDTLFVGRAIQCEGCGHERCPSCPREP